MTEEELLAEEYICNGKCQDDITRNYVHCKTCTRLKDFLAGYKVGKTDLEKENAELKEQCSILADCNTCTSACKTENIEMKNNLTKAKEIIKTCLGFMQAFGYSPSIDKFVTDAEQFISEVEK